MKTSYIVKSLSFSIIIAIGTVACGLEQKPSSSTQTLHSDHEMVRRLVVKCNGKTSAESQLALQLSETCRKQNSELKAKGLAACQEDYCSEVLKVAEAKKGFSTGINAEAQTNGKSFELDFFVFSEFSVAQKEQNALICYAPELKALELLNTVDSSCN